MTKFRQDRDRHPEQKPKKPSDTQRILYEHDISHQNEAQIRADIAELRSLVVALGEGQPSGLGHFSMHVTGIDFPNKETPPMPATDVTPQLDLASASVRAKISVVDPKRQPGNTRVPSADVAAGWKLTDESEAGAGALEAAPDDTMKDEAGAEIIGEDGLPIPVYSTFANTPLEPPDGTRVTFKVTATAQGMADCSKVVSYGNAAVGHFTMIGVEAAEA